LASYPRSGNTLLREILKHCFGIVSQSLYQDHDFSDPALSELVGHEEVGRNPRRFIQLTRLAGRSLYVKTHELPPADGHPVIYVIRDGRSAVVSYTHYLRDVLHRDITLAEVIEGKAGPSWSQHVRAWVLPIRPNTLVVRFEDLAAGNSKTLETIGSFIDQVLLRDFFLSFAHLHELNPSFFRRGSDRANIAELDTASCHLFEQHHGDVLRAMGYG
jgi:hypothetical protein